MRDDFDAIDARVAKYKRSTPPRPGRTGSFYARGMSNQVVALFKAYCRERGYCMSRAVEFLMRDAVANKRKLK
jgi:hypothetical protein